MIDDPFVAVVVVCPLVGGFTGTAGGAAAGPTPFSPTPPPLLLLVTTPSGLSVELFVELVVIWVKERRRRSRGITKELKRNRDSN